MVWKLTNSRDSYGPAIVLHHEIRMIRYLHMSPAPPQIKEGRLLLK